jgi:quercetin dioxygenase-like cupin family protein
VNQTSANFPEFLRVGAGEDRAGEQHFRGTSSFDFKVSAQDGGGIFVVENTLREKGGSTRHIHYMQDEWLYALEGEFLVEAGQTRSRLKQGDSIFLPRNVPHVWAYVGDQPGRILLVYVPAGKIEGFFREVTTANARPAQDPELWRAYDMELVGPPLAIE